MLKCILIGLFLLQASGTEPASNTRPAQPQTVAQSSPTLTGISAHDESARSAWIISLVTAIALVIYTGFAGLQWLAIKKQANSAREQVSNMQGQLDEMKRQAGFMERGLAETEKLTTQNENAVKAMQGQLSEMGRQAGLMEASLDKTRKITAHNEQIVKAMQEQLEITRTSLSQNERAVKAAEESARTAKEAFYVGEAPYFGIKEISISNFESGYCPRFTVILKNGGRTPAWHVHTIATLVLDHRPESENYWHHEAELGNLSESFFSPGDEKPIRYTTSEFRLTPERWEAISTESLRLFLVVTAEYADLRHKLITQAFHYVYYPSTKRFGDYDVV